MTFDELYRQAQSVLNPRQLSESASAGGVSAALLTDRGNVYLGVCIDTACSMGFCAEHAAAAAMITAGESRVVKMIAIGSEGEILPPCGRCREFISQLHDDNREAEVMVGAGTVVRLKIFALRLARGRPVTAPGAPADDTVVVHTHPDYPDPYAEGYPVRRRRRLERFWRRP